MFANQQKNYIEPVHADRLIGYKIQQARHLRSLTVSELASLARLPVDDCEAIQEGRRAATAGQLATIAEALSLHVSFFFDGIVPAPSLPAERARIDGRTMAAAHLLQGLPDQSRQSIISIIEKVSA